MVKISLVSHNREVKSIDRFSFLQTDAIIKMLLEKKFFRKRWPFPSFPELQTGLTLSLSRTTKTPPHNIKQRNPKERTKASASKPAILCVKHPTFFQSGKASYQPTAHSSTLMPGGSDLTQVCWWTELLRKSVSEYSTERQIVYREGWVATFGLTLGLSCSSFLAAASMEAAAPRSSVSAITVGSSGSTHSEPGDTGSWVSRDKFYL